MDTVQHEKLKKIIGYQFEIESLILPNFKLSFTFCEIHLQMCWTSETQWVRFDTRVLTNTQQTDDNNKVINRIKVILPSHSTSIN